jgi:hypothetical protein
MKVVRLNQSISCNEETDISRFLYWMKGDFVMKNFNFWQRWLLVVSWIIVLFGLAMALLNATPIFDFMNDRVNPVFWGDGPVPHASAIFMQCKVAFNAALNTTLFIMGMLPIVMTWNAFTKGQGD